MSGRCPGRRLTRGHLEVRAGVYWNRYRAEVVNEADGTVSSRQARLRLGKFRSHAQALAALERYLALQGETALAPGVAVTFGQYLERFERLRIALMRPQSQRAYRSLLRTHLASSLGHLALQAVDASALQELAASLHARGLSPASIGTVIGRAREVLRHARAAGFAAHVLPRAAVKLPSQSRAEREQRHITAQELDLILGATHGPQHALWAILGFAGLRIGEALGLTWGHVLMPSKTIRVRQSAVGGVISPLKTRTARRDVPMLPQLEATLTAYRAVCPSSELGFLFPTRHGRPMRADDVRTRWLRPLLKRLGLPAAGCHAFRHGLPGRLDALGLSPASIQKFMGHSTITMTERYLHRSTADLHEQLAAALKRAPGAGERTR